MRNTNELDVGSNFLLKQIFSSLLLLIGIQVNAQLNANFTIDTEVGCGPFTVLFNDISQGTGIIYRKWDFGNGNMSIGNVSSPSAVYINVGTYDISLTISDGVDTSTIVKSSGVIVVSPPTPNIILSANSGCVPLQLQLSDGSVASYAPIISWEWDFKDGSLLDTAQNTSHTYLNVGAYAISLKIIDSLGCEAYDSVDVPVVASKPVSSFTNSGSRFICNPPMQVNLVNTSNGVTPLTHEWKLNAQTYNTTNLNTSLTTSGNFDVELVTTDAIGCKDSILFSNYFNVGNFNTTLNAPDTVCLGSSEKYVVKGLNQAQYTWDFGDGSIISGDSVMYSYGASGAYKLKLFINNPGGCKDILEKYVLVDHVSAEFKSYPHQSCKVPMSVGFQDQSTGNITAWSWRFGSNNGNIGSTAQNPTHLINSPGVYDDTLTVTSAFGCTDTFVRLANETLDVVPTTYITDVEEGCAPLTVNFQNQTGRLKNIKSILWNFDLGSKLNPTSTRFSPNYTYNQPGTYTTQLTVTLKNGCLSHMTTQIRVGSKPTTLFSLDVNQTCASDIVSVTNNSMKKIKLIIIYGTLEMVLCQI